MAYRIENYDMAISRGIRVKVVSSAMGWKVTARLVSQGKTIMRLMILTLVLTLCAPAFGQSSLVFMNGNELHQECQNQTPYCVGYVTGVADALEAVTGSVPHTCRPKQVELMQVVDLAVQTLIDNPASRHRPAFNILAEAFVEAWPC